MPVLPTRAVRWPALCHPARHPLPSPTEGEIRYVILITSATEADRFVIRAQTIECRIGMLRHFPRVTNGPGGCRGP